MTDTTNKQMQPGLILTKSNILTAMVLVIFKIQRRLKCNAFCHSASGGEDRMRRAAADLDEIHSKALPSPKHGMSQEKSFYFLNELFSRLV